MRCRPYADALLILREDLRDPALRARGARWKAALIKALDACFAVTPLAPRGMGMLMAAQWQGAVLWWSFDPKGRVEGYVEDHLDQFVTAIIGARPAKPASKSRRA